MKAKWKYITVLTLLLMCIMQVLPFVPGPEECESACCAKPVNCCETEVKTGCDMAMTSCSISMFMPLISAPLVKVNSVIQLDASTFSEQIDADISSQKHEKQDEYFALLHAPPPQYLPLLI